MPVFDFAAVTEGVLSGIAVVALTEVAKRVFRIGEGYFHTLLVRLHGAEAEVEYVISSDADVDAALTAIPADYEVSVRVERTVRRWRDGRWEVIDTTRVAGGPPPALND
jgi:hypothetical protein